MCAGAPAHYEAIYARPMARRGPRTGSGRLEEEMRKCPLSRYSRRATCNAPFEYKVSTTYLSDDETASTSLILQGQSACPDAKGAIRNTSTRYRPGTIRSDQRTSGTRRDAAGGDNGKSELLWKSVVAADPGNGRRRAPPSSR